MGNLKTDRRSQRTQRILHQALIELMQEKPYETITVQDIIDRADVGRSTFYAHYQDKEDLMTRGLMHLMQVLGKMMAQPAPAGELSAADAPRLLPIRELFEHVQEHHSLFKSLVRGKGLDLFIEKGQDYWTRKLSADLQARLPPGQQPAVPIPVLAQFVAGTLVAMLRWWLDTKMPYTPQEMDDMLHRLVMPGIVAGLGIQQ